MSQEHHVVPMLAVGGMTVNGLLALLAKLAPVLSALAVLLQIAIGVVTLWTMWRALRKNIKDDEAKRVPINHSIVPKSAPERVQPDSKTS
jgi:flagellar biosynthesis protein FliR